MSSCAGCSSVAFDVKNGAEQRNLMPEDESSQKEGSVSPGSGAEVYPFDRYLVRLRWPNVRLDSLEFRRAEFPERLYRLSRAYLQAAKTLCEAVGTSAGDGGWPAASVALYCRYLGTELFLKACIAKLDPTPALGHDLAQLRSRYSQLLPDAEFEVPIGLTWRPRDVEELTGNTLGSIDRKPDEILRYGADRSGAASALVHNFVPGYQFNLLTDFLSRAEQIWSHIMSKKNR